MLHLKRDSAGKSITRQDFLKRFTSAAGLNYEQAAAVYEAMTNVFADAVVCGQRVGVGKVLCIRPVRRPPRKVNMGLNGEKKTMYVGSRLVFKVKIYSQFVKDHELKWQI
jgi:hypothetical protein